MTQCRVKNLVGVLGPRRGIVFRVWYIIMKKGSSPVCQMFARELKCGTPHFYSVENISYIYNLDIMTVMDAAKKMGVNFFTSAMKKHLFQLIPHQS